MNIAPATAVQWKGGVPAERSRRLLMVRMLALLFVQPAFSLLGGSSSLCALMGYGCNVNLGCNLERAINYDSTATASDGSCMIPGCTNTRSSAYDAEATFDDGSCHGGCTVEEALNFDSLATWPDGNCSYLCVDPDAVNTGDTSRCIPRHVGCMVAYAINYDTLANTPDNSRCAYGSPPPSAPPPPFGCTDPAAKNYDSAASAVGDTPCTYARFGCTASVRFLFMDSH
jgi:hypothetical protein